MTFACASGFRGAACVPYPVAMNNPGRTVPRDCLFRSLRLDQNNLLVALVRDALCRTHAEPPEQGGPDQEFQQRAG